MTANKQKMCFSARSFPAPATLRPADLEMAELQTLVATFAERGSAIQQIVIKISGQPQWTSGVSTADYKFNQFSTTASFLWPITCVGLQ